MGESYYIIAGFLFLLIWNVVLTYIYFSSTRYYRKLKDDKTGYSLHEILQALLVKFSRNEIKLKELDNSLGEMKESDLKNVSGVGLIRFNPFEEAGGDQSFSLALLDKNKNGIVISSLHGRSGTRIYCKPVKNAGKDKYELSVEERNAIKIATNRIL